MNIVVIIGVVIICIYWFLNEVIIQPIAKNLKLKEEIKRKEQEERNKLETSKKNEEILKQTYLHEISALRSEFNFRLSSNTISSTIDEIEEELISLKNQSDIRRKEILDSKMDINLEKKELISEISYLNNIDNIQSRESFYVLDFSQMSINKNEYLISRESNFISFYDNFLVNSLSWKVPIDCESLVLQLYNMPSKKTINPIVSPELKYDKLDLKPHPEESRFYIGNTFNYSAFELANNLYQNQKKNKDAAVEDYKNKFKVFKLNELKIKKNNIEFETSKNSFEKFYSKYQTLCECYPMYTSGNINGLKEILRLNFENLNLPSYFPQKWHFECDNDAKIFLVDFWLPAFHSLDYIKEEKFLVTKKEIKKIIATEKQKVKIYDSYIYQISLAVLNFIFRVDLKGHVQTLVFNGVVEAPNKSTGLVEKKCILSLMVERNIFLSLNLKDVDAKECFKNLKGVASSDLHSETAIRPILTFNKIDKRFIESQEVISSLDQTNNLATMPWQDFEVLIRDLFSKEFSNKDAEVKVTRASKDGGVDAVVFDPDPIRGGKFVIQAKRYTNTVGVSSVRDLYGTVMNEGANRGILVTTASYGPDAYEFSKDKPITLINGNELLHLLDKHGHKAHINLYEAKKMLKVS
jgi:restriction system protein